MPIFAQCCINNALIVYGNIGCNGIVSTGSSNILSGITFLTTPNISTPAITGGATISGNVISTSPIISTNLISRVPISFTANQTTTINGQSVYKYDLNISQYTTVYNSVEGFSIRYFRISAWLASGGYVDGTRYNYFVEQTIMINYNSGAGIFYYSPDCKTGAGMPFTDTNKIYFIGSGSINYITFINNPNVYNLKYYCVIQDYLA